jgi:ADP-ribose pyrophosphatase YjhB (NUDIX family)
MGAAWGSFELDEDIEAGARREIGEEAGVDVEAGRLTGVYKNMPRGVVSLLFRCHPRSLAWIPPTKLPKSAGSSPPPSAT